MLSWKSILKNFLVGACCIVLSGFNAAHATPSAEGIQVYQKNMHLSAEKKQKLADDIDRYRNADNMWDTLRHEFILPHYESNPIVQEKIAWFMNHQDYLLHSTTRAAPYLYYIMQQVKKRHLPAEVALLPIIESAYNPFAQNASSGAAGIWQMMPGTASGYGIRQNWWYDGRRDVVASTKAALHHLSYLQSFFEGNWLLAIAAYDTGEGNVLAAIRKNIRNGDNTEYWSLPLAQETRDYVPQLLALATIISHPDQYPVYFPPVRNAPYLAQVDIGKQIDLKHAAYLAGLSLTKLKQLNPGYSRAVTDPHGPYKIVLPIENVERFTENLARSPQQKINPTYFADNVKSTKRTPTMAVAVANRVNRPSLANDVSTALQAMPPASTEPYKLQPGDTLYMVRDGDDVARVAKRFHITAQNILAVNKINGALRPGTQLIVPTHPTETASNQEFQLAPGDTVYVVRPGDTIEAIAARFHTNAAIVRLANLLADNSDLHEGDKLVIPTHG